MACEEYIQKIKPEGLEEEELKQFNLGFMEQLEAIDRDIEGQLPEQVIET